MTLKNRHTPLSALPGLTNEQILSLQVRWIWTVEDFYGYAQTLPNDSLAGSDRCEDVLGPDVCGGLSSAHVPVRQMGFSISDTERRATLLACRQRLSEMAGHSFDQGISLCGTDKCPSSVRLMDRMLPIRNQAERGTCSAFASVALCEFAHGGKVAFSPQFLYWACKERDGNPHSDGTSLATVQESIDESGVCEDRLWEYRSTPRYGDDGLLDAGQGPAPQDAVDNARSHRQRCQALSPNAAAKYRRVLASGRPVVVGLMTFNSWTRNPVTEVTGRVFMPHMAETENGLEICEEGGGGHAMCLVGYVDEETAPGGGYFIARNSWGTGWASECAEGAGHALIPYRYVEWFTLSAFTVSESDEGVRRTESDHGVMSSQNPVLAQVPAYLAPYARKLTCEESDFIGRKLPSGTIVLSLKPGDPIYEFTDRNASEDGYKSILAAAKIAEEGRQAQLQAQALQQNVQTAYPLMSTAGLNVLLQRKRDFCARISKNFSLDSLRMRAFPMSSSFWGLMPKNVGPAIRKVEEVMDFSQDLVAAIIKDVQNSFLRNGRDAHLTALASQNPPAAWLASLSNLVEAKILRVSPFSPFRRPLYVVRAFGVPFAFDADSGHVIATCATSRFLLSVETCIRERVAKLAGDSDCVFCSIGTGVEAEAGYEARDDGRFFVTVSSPRKDGGWSVWRPNYLERRRAFRDFLDLLMPLTGNDVLSAVQTIIKGNGKSKWCIKCEDALHDGLIDELRKAFPGFPALRQTAVIEALKRWCAANPGYGLIQEKSGAVCVAHPPIRGKDRPYRAMSRLQKVLLFNLIEILCFMVGIGVPAYRIFFLPESSKTLSFVLLLVPFVARFLLRKLRSMVVILERE